MSDTQTQIHLELSPELQQLLNDNDLSIDEILHQQNIPAEVTYGVLPDGLDAGAQGKDSAMIILATAALGLAVGQAISQVLHTLQRQPQLVEYYELEELKDAKGNVLLDKMGKPHHSSFTK